MPKAKYCCICGKKLEEWGNNPAPVHVDCTESEYVCCDECDNKFVIPMRVAIMYKHDDVKEDIQKQVDEMHEKTYCYVSVECQDDGHTYPQRIHVECGDVWKAVKEAQRQIDWTKKHYLIVDVFGGAAE